MTRYLPGSRAIFANSSASSRNEGRLSASSIQPEQTQFAMASLSLSLDMLYHTVNSTCTIQSQNVLTVTGCNVIFYLTSNVVSHFKRTKLNLTLRRYKYFIDCQVYLRTSTSRREASIATYSTLTAVTLNTK